MPCFRQDLVSGKGAPEKHLVPTALLVIMLHGGGGIPSLEQFSSPLPRVGGLLSLTLCTMLRRTLPHQRIPLSSFRPCFFSHIPV